MTESFVEDGQATLKFVQMVIERLNAMEADVDRYKKELAKVVEQRRGPTLEEVMQHFKAKDISSLTFFPDGGCYNIETRDYDDDFIIEDESVEDFESDA